MGVRQRLEDARFLWEKGRKEGALVQVLVAAAATARVRFPTKGDGAAFRKFIREVTPTIIDATNPAMPGGLHVIFNAETKSEMAFDHLMYKHLRCYLVHEAAMSPYVRFSESRMVDGKLIADFRGGVPLMLPDFWVIHLAKAVAEAPENAVACSGLFPAA